MPLEACPAEDMPGLARKMLIIAAVDGLIVHPLGSQDRGNVLIDYGTNIRVRSTARTEIDDDATTLESYGIIGILNLITRNYLVSITQRKSVAQIQGRPIFEVKDVTLIPLTSQSEAQHVIDSRQKSLKSATASPARRNADDSTDESDAGDESEGSIDGDHDHPAEVRALEPPKSSSAAQSASVVKGIVQDRGKYGRFAERWFSKGGWTSSERRRQGMTGNNVGDELTDWKSQTSFNEQADQTYEHATSKQTPATNETAASGTGSTSLQALIPRVVRTARLYFSSSGFYFSYEHDLSSKSDQIDERRTSLPLWKRFQAPFFWNRHLTQPFIASGQDHVFVPLIQGFVGQRTFSISPSADVQSDSLIETSTETKSPLTTNTTDFTLTLISRRSTSRAGLRYLRRGIDDHSDVANSVETEQILSSSNSQSSSRTYSLVQIRGSMPLFFSQSPYSFKPLPHQFGSESANQDALRKHFENVSERYGSVQVASLVDQHGTEASIGESYERNVKMLNEGGGIAQKPIGFEWFDFHTVCKGMNFGKVQVLLDTLQDQLTTFGQTVKVDGRLEKRQCGVLRTNCMDCLDRTNVVQSAVGGWALKKQLAEMDFEIDLKDDPATHWFNTLWADNGDNISKQYAGTAALKGDFTRTRQRKWTGALSDFSLTLTRYYNNIFGDYFLQTCIDYFLGNTTAASFDDFAADMTTQDLTLDIGRIRQNAIDTSIKIVLAEPHETLIAGHTLACPRQPNTLRSLPFEECVLLLTEAALYHVRFDWDAEKVGSFERVDLADIVAIRRGTYITSTLAETHTDASRNVGFVVRYRARAGVRRANTRSLSSEAVPTSATSDHQDGRAVVPPPTDAEDLRVLAFKALPPRAAISKRDGDERTTTTAERAVSEVESVRRICDELRDAIKAAFTSRENDADPKMTSDVPEIEERDIISLADAKKSTGYMESLGYSLKKLVWS